MISRQKFEKGEITKMDVWFLTFTVFLTHLPANTNGYTFRRSKSLLFALSDSEEITMQDLILRGNRLYLQNSEILSVVCLLVDNNNWTLSRSKELKKQYASRGLQPYMTFKNNTWWKKYKFSSSEGNSSAYWRLEIRRDVFSQDPDDVPLQPWFFSVELGSDLGLFKTTGILVPKEPLFNLSRNLGHVVNAAQIKKGGGEFVVKPAPCCNDIFFVIPFKNKTATTMGGCYIGVTFGAFVPETILWLDLCHDLVSNRSLCHVFSQQNCSDLRLLDIVVTRNYLILATSYGLARSASFRTLMSGEDSSVENFIRIAATGTILDEAFSSGNMSNDLELQYTSYCLDFHVLGDKKDFLYILSGKSKKLVYESVSPFTQLVEMSFSSLAMENTEVLGIVNDITKDTNVFLTLLSSETYRKYGIFVVDQATRSYLMYPPWYFSEYSVANSLHYHPWSNTLFVYGSQVWQSRDGGNSFRQLTELPLTHVVTALSFPQYGDGVIAMTDQGTVYHGRVGLSRLVAIHHQPFPGSLQLLFLDELENIKGFFHNSSHSLNLFGEYFVDVIQILSYQKHFCHDNVLLQFSGHEEILLFVAAPYGHTDQALRRYCLGSYTVGQVFRSRLGGSAYITQIINLNSTSGYFSRVRCKVIKSFTGVSASSAPVLQTNIHLRLIESELYKVIYEVIVPVGYYGWSSQHVGKTVVLASGLSLLLTQYINTSTMYALAPPGISRSVLPQGTQHTGTWQLYDLRSARLIEVRNGEELSLDFILGNYEASATFEFNSSHVGMALVISGDNHGIIQQVPAAGRVVFMNNSMLKLGNYSGWTLYQPILNQTELKFADFSPDTGYGMWWLEEENCANFPMVTPRRYKSLYHLDSRDNLSLQFSLLAKHIHDDSPQIAMYIGNPSLFKINSIHHYSSTNHTLNVELEKKPGISGLAQMSFHVQYTSLKCPSASNFLTIHGGCPPSKRLVFEYPYSFPRSVFLHGSPVDDKGYLRTYKLPPNYRPPSSRGIGIPMSSNLYNVFPEKPPYKERFAISRESRLYKQCEGKSYRKDCDCDDEDLTMSLMIAHSDCINTVYRLVFREIFKPKFKIVEENVSAKSFQDPYYLLELNQRSDYNLLRATNIPISGGTSLTVLIESMNSSVEFSGSGLYHFRAYGVQEGYTLCHLSDEFIVFVDEMPLPHPARDIVRITTAMAFVSALFLAYLWYFYLAKKGELIRVFGDS